jgi:hypothetical protein
MRKFAKSIKNYSKKSGIKPEILQKVYNRGIGAYYTNPGSVRPNVRSPEQWANARVRSFIRGSKKHDLDLRRQLLKDRSYIIEPGQRRNAERIGVKIKPSTRKGKKIDVFDRNGNYITSIGDINYLDYYKYMRIDPQEARIRQRSYLKRHGKNKKGSTGYYANQILWK